MKIPIKKIEEVTGYKIKKNFTSVGFDWATRAGVSFIKTTDKYATIDFIFIEFKTDDSKEKYKLMVKTLENLINSEDLAVIEDVFIGYSRAGSMELAKYHAFAISESIRKGVDYETISAVSCRSKLGIKCSKKAGYGKGLAKKAVADWLNNNFDIKLDDEDASDAIILALLGILIDLDYRSAEEIKKDKKK
jgi:Holliday junction resolvasome RuvABC endonuclease subunit